MAKIENHGVLKANIESPQKVLTLIEELTFLYKKQFKKNPSVDLVFRDSGVGKVPQYDLAVWFNSDNVNEVSWFEQKLSEVK